MQASTLTFDGFSQPQNLLPTSVEEASDQDYGSFGSRAEGDSQGITGGDTPNVSINWGYRDIVSNGYSDHWLIDSSLGIAFFTHNEEYSKGDLYGSPAAPVTFTADPGYLVNLTSVDIVGPNFVGWNGSYQFQVSVSASIDNNGYTTIYDSGILSLSKVVDQAVTIDLAQLIGPAQSVDLIFTFYAVNGTITAEFRQVANGGSIDNVVFTQTKAPSPVPIPSTVFLLGTALASLTAANRKKGTVESFAK